MKFISRTIAASENFLKILIDGDTYTLADFSSKFKTSDFSLDEKLKECIIEYRGTNMTYNEMCKKHFQFSESLHFFNRYNEEIYPLEHFILICNTDYYKAAKFLHKAEKCLQTARYYLLCSENLLSTDYEINWSGGYQAQFGIRTYHFTTAVIWYNNCFDYILQIVYLAFALYKKVSGYDASLPFEDLLKKCRYETLEKIYNANNAIPSFVALWNIISDCRNALSNINLWANFIKHKGGIEFEGTTPPTPLQMSISDENGNKVAENSEFDAIVLDLDHSIHELGDVHKALHKCLDEIVTFIDFNAAIPTKDATDGKLLIPDKTTYVKILLP